MAGTVNLAEKYSSKIDEVMMNGALSEASINKDYEFSGAKAVKVYSFDTVEMNDYQREGTNRYGTPEELPDNTQEMILTQDKSFTFTIDKGNRIDTPEGVRDAGTALRRQIEQKIKPMIDKYRFTKIAEGAAHVFFATEGVSSTTAYSIFLDANEAIDEDDVPSEGRVANVSPKFLKELKKDENFIKSGDSSQKMLISGQVGEVDGVAIVKVASSRLPAGCLFEITHKAATTSPIKLAEYKIHQDPPGISGQLAEGRVYFDAFVLDKKKNMISVVYGNTGSLTLTATAGSSSTKSKVKVTGNTAGGTLVYKGDYASAATAAAAIDVGDDVSGWTAFPSNGEVTTADGKYIAVAVKVNGKCVSGGTVAAVVGS